MQFTIIGPSKTVPVSNGEFLLSTWQNIFLRDFAGPRSKRAASISPV